MNDNLYLSVLPEEQLHLFEVLASQEFIKKFYLAGGTCLALQIGHRRSIDFDFFTPEDFDTKIIVNRLAQIGDYQRDDEGRNTINGSLNGVRISFFGYKYKIIDNFKYFESISLTGLKDIAAMKLEAIAGRGSKKDFFDMYFLLQHFSLNEVFSFHSQKYGTGLSNQYLHLKSLVYFADAEAEAMPLMLTQIKWEAVKKKMIKIAREFQSEL